MPLDPDDLATRQVDDRRDADRHVAGQCDSVLDRPGLDTSPDRGSSRAIPSAKHSGFTG
jgi:hypothetical protein